MMIDAYTDIIVILSTLIAAEWAIAYHRKTQGDWWHIPMGRHLMVFALVLAVILGGFAVGDVLEWFGYHEPPWFRAAHVATYTALPAVLIWRRILLHRAQNGSGHS